MNSLALNNPSLSLSRARTWLIAALFVAGNIMLPQICHLIPQGGMIFLPIYFFTLVGAYAYGWKVGLLTAVVSPLVNSLLFGMPPIAAVPVIETKSVILALSAAIVASRSQRISLPLAALAVAAAAVVGSAFEWAYTGSFMSAVQDFQLGWPGLLIQVVGGFFAIRAIAARRA